MDKVAKTEGDVATVAKTVGAVRVTIEWMRIEYLLASHALGERGYGDWQSARSVTKKRESG